MKLLGLIGGTSYHSTLEYYREINEKVSHSIGSSQNPELLLYSINIDVMRRQDENEINQTYLKVAQTLEQAGAEALMICANTPHMSISFVQPRIGIPFLHIADAVGVAAKNAGYKNLLLLGNKPTMTRPFLKSYLVENYDLQILIPDEENIAESHYFVSKELTQGHFTSEAIQFYMKLISTFESKVDAVILGCTELPILLKNENTRLPFLKTTDLHIQMAIDYILTET
ncbi:aspartate/glutamate racemase family protein [Psychroflexus montanilacus]|uniref:aspartate/glutamate racemase family protein n=1 Tax=Psychroflexus montanilacus TaxID=2873598 RepID=UPI001CCDB1BD|nr:amino acid racemase [Psychroflexus montanilacus]MBZ9651879.1 amino acid racemase [Psychroflexus montanilacus]